MSKYWKIIGLLLICLSLFILPIAAEEEEEIPVIGSVYDVTRAGPYYMELYMEHNNVVTTKLVLMNVILEKTIVSDSFREAIDASDFYIEEKDIHSLTKEDLILLADAHAWNLDTGEHIAVVEVVVQKQEAIEGAYDVTFSTQRGTSTTVNAYERTNLVSNLNVSYRNQNRTGLQRRYSLLVIQIGYLCILPLIVLFLIYWLTRNRLKKTAELLYRKEK